MKVKDIVHENKNFWVYRDKKHKMYVVFKNTLTHSVSDSAFPLSDNGLSLAIARCDYLQGRKQNRRSV